MTRNDQKLLQRWLEGQKVGAEIRNNALGKEQLAEWEAQSSIDALLLMQEGKLALSEGFQERLMARAKQIRRPRRRAKSPTAPAARRSRRSLSPLMWGAVAASLLVCAGVGIWLAGWGETPRKVDGPAPVEVPVRIASLAPGWQVKERGAEYRIVEPGLVRLVRGELYVEAIGSQRGTLKIETDAGVASARETKFYIGSHKEKGTETKSTTRVLVLSGEVTLANPQGTVTGEANDLLAVKKQVAPVKHAVQANSDFAFELYRHLATENEGENLFFSPFSVSGALAMAAEGARGETALEMGRVLQFPVVARRVGDDAQRIPWETALIHTGMAGVSDTFNRSTNAETTARRAELKKLEERYTAIRQQTRKLFQEGHRDSPELKALHEESREIGKQIRKLEPLVPTYEVRVANALWGEQTYPFSQQYVKTIDEYYGTGGLFRSDFKGKGTKARLKINEWVEKQTNSRIKDLVPEGTVNQLTRLVVTSALYFRAPWMTPFREKYTENRDFMLTDGSKTRTRMMYARDHDDARYAAFNADGSYFKTPASAPRRRDPKTLYPGSDGFAMVELPYDGNDFSMLVIAPNDPKNLAALEKKLTASNLRRWVGKLEARETHVYLPKFKLETAYTLGEAGTPRTLQKMGMVRAFQEPGDSSTGAQFHGMTTSKDPQEQLFIERVIHKTFLVVDESGTEAAAAPVIMFAKRVPEKEPRFVPEFRADRPFIFMIRERKTGSLLFIGRVTHPAN